MGQTRGAQRRSDRPPPQQFMCPSPHNLNPQACEKEPLAADLFTPTVGFIDYVFLIFFNLTDFVMGRLLVKIKMNVSMFECNAFWFGHRP